jgi:hypothetical protein
MDKNVRIYKPNKIRIITNGSVVLGIILFGLTLPVTFNDSPTEARRLVGLAGFWLIGILVSVIPLGFTLEVGQDYVKTMFLKRCLRTLRSSNIERFAYRNLFRGGLGFGKGLVGWEKLADGRRKYFSIGEQAYGKEAIVQAKRVLES